MALKKRGFLTVPEVARDIIKEQLTLGGNEMHKGDRQAFLEKMLVHSLDDYLKIQNEKLQRFLIGGSLICMVMQKRFATWSINR